MPRSVAAWAIIEEASQVVWDEQDAPPTDDGEGELFTGLIGLLFEDSDFRHLFTPAHDGIDETELLISAQGTKLGAFALAHPA